jgi:Protein of unknown function (DUF4058)
MPSVFPGMDPYLEGYEWDDFHPTMVSAMRAALVPVLKPDYSVRSERRVYVEHPFGDSEHFRPDISVLRTAKGTKGKKTAASPRTSTIEPVERTLIGPYQVEEKYLVVRKVKSKEVVTVIELLSPANKRPGGEGFDEYLEKRDEILQSRTNFVEIDLLRGGLRLPTQEPLPSGDDYAFVCRAKRRLKVDVYAWSLPHALPVIPIPLSAGDREVSLDLQQIFNGVYDSSGYDYSVDYSVPVTPPLKEADATWAKNLLKSNRTK